MLTTDQAKEHFAVTFNTTNPVSSEGLSTAEVAARLEKHGPNQLSPPKRLHPFFVFLGYVGDRFNVLLIICGIINFFLVLSYSTENGERKLKGTYNVSGCVYVCVCVCMCWRVCR